MWQRATTGASGGGGTEIKQGVVTSTSSGASIDTGFSDIDFFAYWIDYSVELDGAYLDYGSFSNSTYKLNVCKNGANAYYNNLTVSGGNVSIPASMTGSGRTVYWIAGKFNL